MRQRIADFEAHSAQVLVISFGTIERVQPWAERLALPFPVAADAERSAYAAYGVGSGSFWDIWGPRVLWRYLVLRLRGNKLQKPTAGDDLDQLGGDFVIDAEGRLLFTHVARTPVDRPEVSLLLDALAGIDGNPE